MLRTVLSRTLFASAALLAGLASTQVSAQAYPNKPIKIIVPFAPGGGSDFIARFIAQRLQTALGQPVLIDNRPGAGGNIGTEAGVNSPADGYTLILIASSYTTNQAIYKAKYDPNADITPIIQLSEGPMLLVANPGFKPNTAKEMIELAKAKPDEITFASAGTGSITHMTGELFANAANIKLNHIPYKGSGPAMTDTIGGQVNVFFSTTAESITQVNAGKVKAIGVTTTKRLAALPNVPTIAESGLPGYDVAIWHGLIAPKGVPKEVVEKINREANKILLLKESAEQLEKNGVLPAGGTPEKFKAQIAKEIVVWKKLVVDRNIKAE